MSLQTTSPASGNLQGSGKTTTGDEILGSSATGVKASREDRVAALRPLVERMFTGHCWIKGKDGYRQIDEPFDEIKLSEHVMQQKAYGLCPIAPGDSTVRAACLDFDSHKGGTPWADMRKTAGLVMTALENDGLKPIEFRSSGGKGLHLWLVWDAQQDAYSVREMLRAALATCDLVPGTKGVAAGQVEIFPKQSEVPANGYGNMVVLPGAGKSKRLTPGVEWPMSDPVPGLQRPVREHVEVKIPDDLVTLRAALDAIPNAGENELNYDEWRNALFGIHDATGGSDVGLTLAHEFSAKSSKYDPDFLDHRIWPHISSEREDRITVRTLYRLAAPYGFIDPTIAADFEDERARVAASVAGTPLRFRFLSAGEFADRKSAGWIVRGVLPAGDVAVIYGEPGSGKTFFALDLVVAIALGVEWRGKKVKQGRVAYIAAEDDGGVQDRLKAQAMHRGLTPADIGIHFLPDAPNFLERSQIADVIAGLKACGPVSVVVVDTLARVTAGGNENAGEDMGKVLGHCTTIWRATGALVILVHHSGKDASKGARGWSGIKAAVHAEISILRAADDRVATVAKLKNGQDGEEFGFRLQQVPVRLDDDGEVVTSCVVEHMAAAKKIGRGKKPKEGDHERRVMQALHDLVGLGGGQPTVTEVVDEAVNQTPYDASAKRDRRREYVFRALNTLESAGRVVVAGQRVGFPSAD